MEIIHPRDESKSVRRIPVANITKYNSAANQGGKARKYLSLGRVKWERVSFVRDVWFSLSIYVRSLHSRLQRMPMADENKVNIYWRSEGGYKPLFVHGYSRSSHSSWGRTLKRRHTDRSIGFSPFIYRKSAVSWPILLYSVYRRRTYRRFFTCDKIASSDNSTQIVTKCSVWST